MNPAERILRTLGKHLRGPGEIRLLGGAALILGYGHPRTTEDADLLMEDAELEALIESADLGTAVAATNSELEPLGLYLTHIWGPEHQILTPEWRAHCRVVDRDWGTPNLTVTVLGPIDLILSKLCRADEQDLADIGYVFSRECLDRRDLEAALLRAVVPPAFAGVFPESVRRLRHALFPDPQ